MKTLKKMFVIIGEVFRKMVNSNPTINTEIAIRQGKARLVKFFDSLAKMEVQIGKRRSSIKEIEEKRNNLQLIVDAAIEAKNRNDVKLALSRKKVVEGELATLEAELKKDMDLAVTLKLQYGSAKTKIESAERNLESLKARKESLSIKKELLGTGKSMLFGEDEALFSMDDLQKEVEKTEALMGAEDVVAGELSGDVLEEKYSVDSLDAEVDALMDGD